METAPSAATALASLQVQGLSFPTPAAASTPTTVPIAGGSASPPAPAAQLAPALFSLAHKGGSDVLTVRLEPASLGLVEVQITRPPDGPATVAISAQQSATLLLLLRDQTGLQQTLNRAGIPAGSPVSFHLAPPTPITAPAPSANNGGPALASAGFGFTPSGQAPGSGPRRRRTRAAPGTTLGATAPSSHRVRTNAVTRWLRAGLDITA